MRAVARYGFLLAALFASTAALAGTSEPGTLGAASGPEPTAAQPHAQEPPPAPPTSPTPPPIAPPPALTPPSTEESAPPAAPVAATTATLPVAGAPLPAAESPRLDVDARGAPAEPREERSFTRNYRALPLSVELRFGFNTRLSSSFDASAREELLDSSWAIASYLAWNREYAVGLEFEHSGLGRVRGVSDRNSIDAEYSATGAWLAARVFPVRRERFDLFVNLRVGLVFQHVSAVGVRADVGSITVPATVFSCSEWDGPGLGLGGAVGAAYRISRHFAAVARFDATGARLSGDPLAGCADGIGSVASVNGTVGLAYEFETAPK